MTHSEPKSLSRETTFEHDLHPKRDRHQLSAIFTQLCERLADDLTRKGYQGRTIGIKLRFEDFSTVTRDHTVEIATASASEIRAAAGLCLKRVVLGRKLRLLGVRMSSLVRPGAESDQTSGAASLTGSATQTLVAEEPRQRLSRFDPQLVLFDSPSSPQEGEAGP